MPNAAGRWDEEFVEKDIQSKGTMTEEPSPSSPSLVVPASHPICPVGKIKYSFPICKDMLYTRLAAYSPFRALAFLRLKRDNYLGRGMHAWRCVRHNPALGDMLGVL